MRSSARARTSARVRRPGRPGTVATTPAWHGLGLLAMLLAGLAGCGQTGPLYLPERPATTGAATSDAGVTTAPGQASDPGASPAAPDELDDEPGPRTDDER